MAVCSFARASIESAEQSMPFAHSRWFSHYFIVLGFSALKRGREDRIGGGCGIGAAWCRGMARISAPSA